MGHGKDPAFGEKISRVEEPFSPRIGINGRSTYDGGYSLAFLGNGMNRQLAFMNEVVKLKKIPGRITGNSEYCKDYHIGSISACLLNGSLDLAGIPIKVTNMVI
jgi:hypothetical protein